MNVSPGWQTLSFLTGEFTSIFWLVNLSLVSSALVNAAYLLFEPALVQVSHPDRCPGDRTGRVSADVAGFAFDFSGSSIPWTGITRALIIIAIFGSVVALVSEMVKLARLTGGPADAGAGSRSFPRS